MTPRPRRVRPVLRDALCPGCRRPVRLRGHLELIPPHTVLDDDPPRDERGRVIAVPCRWGRDSFPGRPDGHVSRETARRLAARVEAERARHVA